MKTDDNYFISHWLGGDHALKFGVGWRRNPALSFTHIGGGAQATVQCVNNDATLCGSTGADGANNKFVAAGSAGPGLVPLQADLFLDNLTNHNWWTYNSYIQDSYTTKRLTISGGVRQDYQNSQFLGGCVQANPIAARALAEELRGRGESESLVQRVLAARVGHLRSDRPWHDGDSRQLQLLLPDRARARGRPRLPERHRPDLGVQNCHDGIVRLAGASCWNDANHDGIIQANELIGTPQFPSQFVNGVLTGVVPQVDPNLKLARTREAVVGIDHQLAGDLHVSVDYTHRDTDFGSAGATCIGDAAGGGSNFPSSQNWVGPFTFTDKRTGLSAPYFTLCAGCTQVSRTTQITSTTNAYQTYNGASVTLTKRLSNRWQGNVSYHLERLPAVHATGSVQHGITGHGYNLLATRRAMQFASGFTNNTPAYTVKGFAQL